MIKLVALACLFRVSLVLSQNLLGPDGWSIRPFNSPLDETGWCVYKRWGDYVQSQELWIWPCTDGYHTENNRTLAIKIQEVNPA